MPCALAIGLIEKVSAFVGRGGGLLYILIGKKYDMILKIIGTTLQYQNLFYFSAAVHFGHLAPNHSFPTRKDLAIV